MVMSDLGAAGMIMMGVLLGLFPPEPEPGAPGDAPALGVVPEPGLPPPGVPGGLMAPGLRPGWPPGPPCLFLLAWLPSVTLFRVMPEKVPVVSMLKPCVSSLARNCSWS